MELKEWMAWMDQNLNEAWPKFTERLTSGESPSELLKEFRQKYGNDVVDIIGSLTTLAVVGTYFCHIPPISMAQWIQKHAGAISEFLMTQLDKLGISWEQWFAFLQQRACEKIFDRLVQTITQDVVCGKFETEENDDNNK